MERIVANAILDTLKEIEDSISDRYWGEAYRQISNLQMYICREPRTENEAEEHKKAARKEIGEWIQKFTDFDGDSLRPILTREWAAPIEFLMKGEMPPSQTNKSLKVDKMGVHFTP